MLNRSHVFRKQAEALFIYVLTTSGPSKTAVTPFEDAQMATPSPQSAHVRQGLFPTPQPGNMPSDATFTHILAA